MAAAVSKNNAYSTLAGALTNVATSLTVQTGHGDRFPIVAGSDWAIITLADAAGNVEIIKVTARGSGADTMTIVRAQEGTAARAWNIGDIVEQRPTVGTVATLNGAQTFTNKTIDGGSNTLQNVPTAALVVVSAIKAVLDAATLLAARAALGLTAIGEALATAASAAAARAAIGAAESGANTSITSVGAINGVTAAERDNSTKLATTAYADRAGVPAGTIIDFAGTAAPAGYLACPTVATNISRTTYATLFAAIGTTWGAGDGSTTFGMPWFPADYTAVQANANVGTATTGDVKAHTHTVNLTAEMAAGSNSGSMRTGATTNTGSTGGSANLAAGHRVLKCVKT